jgi:large subunit ribosomal protein L29
MRPDEIRELGSDDVASRIKELQEERFRLTFRSATEPLEDPLRLRVIRRDIARLKTILRERELGRAPAAAKKEKAAAKAKADTKETAARRPAKKGATKTKAR